MTSAIVTTPAGPGATYTQYDNQRKTGRLPNGNLLDMIVDGTTMNFFHSKDGGVTWVAVATGSGIPSVSWASLFTDEVDGIIRAIHVSGNTAHVRRGVPTYDGSGVMTTITWKSLLIFFATTTGTWLKPDLVSHREGTGWKIHVVSYNSGGALNYQRINEAADGTLTSDATEISLNATSSTTGDAASIAVDSSKNVYVSWHAGATGVGKGVRFRMATYANGVHTWLAEEAITEALYPDFMGPCLVDKAGRAVVALHDNAATHYYKVYRRSTGGTWADISPTNLTGGRLTLTLHTNDDIYLIYDAGDVNRDMAFCSYAGVWSNPTIVPTLMGGLITYPSASRYTDGSTFDVVCTTGSGTHYVEHMRINVPKSGGKSRRGYNVTCLGRGRRGVWSF